MVYPGAGPVEQPELDTISNSNVWLEFEYGYEAKGLPEHSCDAERSFQRASLSSVRRI